MKLIARPTLTYTSCRSAKHNVSSHTTWENWDISAIISGAKVVEVWVHNQTNMQIGGVRRDGSSDVRTNEYGLGEVDWTVMVEPVGDVIEIFSNGGVSTNDFYINGYWM